MQGQGRTHMQESEHSQFARELNSALGNNSFSPEIVVKELNRRGFPLPLRTFNYWLQGFFLPRFESTFRLISALENILGVTDSRLSDSLLHDLSTGRYRIPRDFDRKTIVGTPPKLLGNSSERFFTIIDGKVDWSADLVRKAIKDEIRINEDFTEFCHSVTVLGLVPDAPNPSLTISTIYEEGENFLGEDSFYDIKGARVGKIDSYKEDDVTVYGIQLYLPDGLIPGQLHEISYTWDFETPKPTFKMAERIFPQVLDFYSATLIFDGDVPQGIEYVTYADEEEELNPKVSDIPVIRQDNTVSITTGNFGDIAGYFRCLVPEKDKG